jgi:hypothetical protein
LEDGPVSGSGEPGFYEDLLGGVFSRLLDFLNRLDAAHIVYDIKHIRPDSIMVEVPQPGWFWEIELMADGSIDIERYRSVAGVENDPELLEELFRDN